MNFLHSNSNAQLQSEGHVAYISTLSYINVPSEDAALENILLLTINKLNDHMRHRGIFNPQIHNVINCLDILVKNMPKVVYEDGDVSHLGWVNRNDLNTIYLNKKYEQKFKEDSYFLKSTLIHEAVHCAGFFHGHSHQDIAYVIQYLMYPKSLITDETLHTKYDKFAHDILENSPKDEKYQRAFINFYSHLPLSFAEVASHKKLDLSSFSTGNIEFINNHLVSILGNQNDATKLLVDEISNIKKTGNIYSFNHCNPQSKAIKKYGNVHGF